MERGTPAGLGEIEGLWLGGLARDPGQVSGGGVSLGGLAIKSFAVSCPSRKYLSGRQRGLGGCLSPGADAKGPSLSLSCHSIRFPMTPSFSHLKGSLNVLYIE